MIVSSHNPSIPLKTDILFPLKKNLKSEQSFYPQGYMFSVNTGASMAEENTLPGYKRGPFEPPAAVKTVGISFIGNTHP